MIIYFDTCCYCRLYDNQSQVKIATEAVAVMSVIDLCRIAGHRIIGSMAVTSELGDIPNADLRETVEGFYNDTIDGEIILTAADYARAEALRSEGLGDMDSLHLAAAEAVGVDVLLTTDGQFARVCEKKNLSNVKVINPLNFIPEIIK